MRQQVHTTRAPVAVSRTERFFQLLAQFCVRARWFVVLAWAGAAVAATLALPSMGSEINNNNSQFLPANAPSEQAANLAAPLIGSINTESQVMIVALARGPAGQAGGQLTAADAAAIAREAAAARDVRHVLAARVVGVSRDGEAALVEVTVGVAVTDITRQRRVVDALEAQVRAFDASAQAERLHLQMHLAGPVATNVANQVASQRTGNKVQAISVLLIIVLLLVIFRSVLAPLITLAPAGVALVVSMRLIGWLGAGGLKISEVTELLLIVLLLGAGTDYGLFLVFRAKEELAKGLSPHDAVSRALARVGESISASAGTVIVALLTLLLASFGLYHDLAVPLALGVAVMLFSGLTLLPALLAIFARAAFWPGGVGRFGLPGSSVGKRAEADRQAKSTWETVATKLVARPARSLVAGVALFAALALAALGYYSAGFGGALSAPAGSDAAIGDAILARHFPAASANPSDLVFAYRKSVWLDPVVLVKVQESLERSGLFSQLVGPLGPNGTPLTPVQLELLHAELGPPASLALPEPPQLAPRVSPAAYSAYRSLVQLVSADGQVVQWEANLKSGPQGSTGAMRATPAVRRAVSEAARASGAYASGVAGQAAALYDVSNTSNHDILEIVPVAIAAIGVVLGLALRSLVAPIYLIASVGLSYMAALGVSTIVFMYLAGSDGITFILPFLMFIFLLALGEDYNILVMTRIREEARSAELTAAVAKAVGRTGPTVTSAGIVLAGTFGVLAFSASGPGSSQVRDVGFGLAIGILMDTFVVRTLLVPATVALLGRWNWWPARLRAAGADCELAEPGTLGLPGS